KFAIALTQQFAPGQAAAVFGHVERSLLDVDLVIGGDPQRRQQRGVQVGDVDWIFNGRTRALGRRSTVQQAALRSAAEQQHARSAGEVAVHAVEFQLVDDGR